VETELRAASGKLLLRPFGRFRPFPGFDELLFDPAQLARLPTPEHVPVDMAVVLGPRAARPLRIEIPLLVTGMGYAVALSLPAKVALARGAAEAGTATNTGQGPFLPEERRAARALVIQYPRADWNKSPEVLREADMIEIQFGQGALGGSGLPVPAQGVPPALRRAFGLRPGEPEATVHSRMPGVETPSDLAALVAGLRAVTGGVPIGLKVAATGRIESDLDVAVRAGVDFVTVDGAEGGTHGAPPVLGDDFGLPTFIALCRASRYLAGLRPAERPSLIVSGGLFTPGHFLKALALGADAVAIGTAALFALGHDQVTRALPWEPPLDIVWFGRPAARRLDVDKAARSLARYLASVRREMEVAVRALGKASVRELSRGDLMALDARVADLAGVRYAWLAQPAPTGAPRDALSRTVAAHLEAWAAARETLADVLDVLSLGR
jgi:glutamate synthase domain-containing protein 2